MSGCVADSQVDEPFRKPVEYGPAAWELAGVKLNPAAASRSGARVTHFKLWEFVRRALPIGAEKGRDAFIRFLSVDSLVRFDGGLDELGAVLAAHVMLHRFQPVPDVFIGNPGVVLRRVSR